MNVNEMAARCLAEIAAERAAAEARAARLAAQGCGDDAVLARIALNICDVFAAVVRAAENQAKDDADAYRAFCSSRFAAIPAAWQENFARAQAHGDFRTQAVEQVKLETAQRLQRLLDQATEAET